MKTSQVTTLGAQIGGSSALSIVGGQQQQNMMMNGATQLQAYQAQAALQMKAATLQTTIGAAQIAMGILEGQASDQHKKNAAKLNRQIVQNKNAVTCPGGVYNAQGKCLMYGAAAGNDLAQNAMASKAGDDVQLAGNTIVANKELAGYGVAAAKEQNALKTQASSQSLQDYMKGGQTVAAGVLAMMAAKEAEALAAKLANASPVPLPSGADAFNGNPEVPRMPTVIGGDPSANSSPAPFSPVAAAPGGTMGSGLGDLGGPGGGNGAPAPGDFAAGAPGGTSGGSGGGSGGGLGGSTSTSAAPPGSAEDPQAKYANNGSGGAAYQGGGIAMGGGGGGGKGSPGNDPISLKDAMAQMMGQGAAGDKPGEGVDIMNYRNLASDSQYAPLSRNEDFFKHFHDTYQGLQKKGRIGQ